MSVFNKLMKEPDTLPLLVLVDPVLFPGMPVPLHIQDESSRKSIDHAMSKDRLVAVFYTSKSEPAPAEKKVMPYEIGLLCRIIQVMKLPSGGMRLLIEPVSRIKLQELQKTSGQPCDMAAVHKIEEDHQTNESLVFLMRSLSESFAKYAEKSGRIPSEITQSIQKTTSAHRLSDLACSASALPWEEKIQLLQETNAAIRLEKLLILLETEAELLDFKKDIQNRVRQRLEKTQKDYFINEQIKELNRELGSDEDLNGIKELEEALGKINFDEATRKRINTELKRLSRLQAMSPEAGILRTWLEWISDLPWHTSAPVQEDIAQAQIILNEDHYDLEEAKDRILEYLSARQFNPRLKAPILCFAGPPGTGKTSLGKSLARATGRSFFRISLGGLRDEAEMRGHRRTYVGALPGKIIQTIRKAGVNNPVILLDEIDKLANDYRGDPASALLEILDPEQNNSFTDHYLELPFDLSNVLFVASANDLSRIPAPLRDRMDIIEIPGYTQFEKKAIARNFIIPKQLREHGLDLHAMDFTESSLDALINDYTHEAGVRNLERAIIRMIRKAQRRALDAPEPGSNQPAFPALSVDLDLVRKFLKNAPNRDHIRHRSSLAGLVYGLAWTEAGGRVLPVEVTAVPGKGSLNLTGKLGEVMKESAMIALTVVKASLSRSNPSPDLSAKDIHIHVPEGATPKDGPSAGITLASALYSILADKAFSCNVAMTGELTITGRVLPVGGIREKVLAAQSNGFTSLIVPEANRNDVDELPPYALEGLSVHFAKTFEDVIHSLLGIA